MTRLDVTDYGPRLRRQTEFSKLISKLANQNRPQHKQFGKQQTSRLPKLLSPKLANQTRHRETIELKLRIKILLYEYVTAAVFILSNYNIAFTLRYVVTHILHQPIPTNTSLFTATQQINIHFKEHTLLRFTETHCRYCTSATVINGSKRNITTFDYVCSLIILYVLLWWNSFWYF